MAKNKKKASAESGGSRSQQRVVRRREANKIVRTVGLVVKRGKVDADKYSMTHRVIRPSRGFDAQMIDLHGVDTITAAEIIQSSNAAGEPPATKTL